MALQVQTQTISLAGGMNEKIPRELLPAGQMSFVKNGRWRQVGMVETRLGYSSLATGVLGGGTLPASGVERLLVRDDELCRLAENGIYSYSPEAAKWVRRDKVPEPHLYADRRISAVSDVAIQVADMAVITNGMQCIAWSQVVGTTRELHAGVFAANGQLIVRQKLGGTSPQAPRVVAVGSTFVVIYVSTSVASTLYAVTIDGSNPASFSAQTSIVTDLQGTGNLNWDVASASTFFIIAYQKNSSELQLRRFDAALVAGPALAEAGTSARETGIYLDGAAVYVAYNDVGTGGLEVSRYDEALTTRAWNVTAIAGGGAGQGRLTIGSHANATIVRVVRDQGSPTPGGILEWISLQKTTGAATGLAHETRNVTLASKIFSSTNDSFIAVRVAVGQEDQEGLILCALGDDSTSDGNAAYRLRPVAKWLTAKVLWGTTFNHLPQAAKRGSVYYIAHTEKDFASRGAHVTVSRFDLQNTNRWARIEDRDTALVAAGMLHQYDGDQLVEIPFAWYPYFSIQAIAEAVNPLPFPGDYQYTVVYEWTDARGRIHRSVPAIPQTVTIAANQKAELTIAHLTVTSRSDLGSAYRSALAIAVYRRNAATPEAPYVRLAAVSGGTYPAGSLPRNDPLATGPLVFVDSGPTGPSGQRWTTGEQPNLYTFGGALEAAPHTSCRVLTKWDNRVFLGGCDNANAIWYSRELVEGEPPMFHENQQIFCEEKVTGLVNFDSSLVVFSDNAIWVMQGQGPNDRGEGSTYTGLIKLPSDVGCRDWRTLCVTEEGIFFQHRSGEGIYLLDRALSVSYVGAPIENHATVLYPTVTSAVAVPAEDEVRFSVTNGVTGRLLVYNTLAKQWMVHELYRELEIDPRDALMWRGAYVWSKNQLIAQQSALTNDHDTVADVARLIPLELETGDISLAGPLGTERQWRAIFFGRRLGGQHGLDIQVAYDQSAFVETKSWTSQEVDAWTCQPEEVFEIVAKSRQETRAIRFKVQVTPGETTFHAVGLMALALESGAESGVARLPEEQRR